MATRDSLYKCFGPILVEAVARVMFSEINILRQRAGLEVRTIQQAVDAINDQISHLSKYDWMDP